LIFDREKERGGRIDASGLAALSVGAAQVEVVCPEEQTRGIGLAIEKIVVMLRDESLRIVDWICGRS